LKITLKFLYYDFWIGLFWDRPKRILYACPLPMIVLKLDFGPKKALAEATKALNK
jgi:hypothetical protein